MFTVVMPAYNASLYIRPAIESILTQTFRDFELLIIDNHSSDDTVRIAREYEARDSRVRVIAKPENRGISDSQNLGMREARFDWIAVQDADDVALPHRLERQAAAIRANPHVIAWGASRNFVNADGRLLFISELGPQSVNAFHELRRAGAPVMLAHPTFVYNRRIGLEVGGYDERLSAALDLEFMDRLSDRGVLLSLPDILVNYLIHPNSSTSTKFFRQEYEIRYIFERRHRVAHGGPWLTWEQYEQNAARKSRLQRLWERRQGWGRLLWYRAGIAMGERAYFRMAGQLAVSMLYSPQFTGQRVFTQVQRRLKARGTV